VVEEIIPAGDRGEYLLDHADALSVRYLSYRRISRFDVLFSRGLALDTPGFPHKRPQGRSRAGCVRYMNLSKRSFSALHIGHIPGGSALAHR
jgi:hypothetical protein